jgi:hypothetical protein
VSKRGDINGWTCDTCRETTYCVHVDYGVTPMFLACRAEGVEPREATCKGRGTSLMYPSTPPPQHVIAAVQWEWYMPDEREKRGLAPETREHVDKGGLLLRPLTAAGPAGLPEAS